MCVYMCACLYVYVLLHDNSGILGHDAYIDSNGDAEANYTVLALQPDDNTYGFAIKPVGRFLRDAYNRQKLVRNPQFFPTLGEINGRWWRKTRKIGCLRISNVYCYLKVGTKKMR